MKQKRTKRDMAYYLDIDVSTLYNWRKYKPNLYRIVMLGFKFDEVIEAQRRLGDELEGTEQEIRQEIEEYGCKG
ncbi:transcriptional regulator [Helicobacter cinaedi]|nr:transcriptional regulator [Helicobacter cinaedi]